jgi:phage tail protein X
VASEGGETPRATAAPQIPVEPRVPVEPAAQSSNSPSPAPASRPASRTTEVARRSGSSATRFAAAAAGVIALIVAVTVVARSSLRPILRGATATESQTGDGAEPAAVQGAAPGGAESEPSAANVATANDPIAEHPPATQPAPGEAPAEHGPSVAAAPPPIASQPAAAAAPAREPGAAEQTGAAQPAANTHPAPADSAPPHSVEIARRAPVPVQEANSAGPVVAKDTPAERPASRAKAKASARHDEPAPPSVDAHKDPASADDGALEPVGDDEEVESAPATGVQDLQLSPSHLPGRGKRVLVRRGDTLMNLAAREYGSANFTTLDVVKAANPTVQDVNKIVAGTELTFPDPGPAARIVPRGKGLAVIVMTTPNQQRALATQRELRARYSSPVEIESVDLSDGRTLYRVSMGDYQETTQALKTAESLGNILSDRGL